MEIRRIDPYRWEIPRQGAMRVPGVVYTDAALEDDADLREPLQQVANVATLPGIVKASLAMPDMHWGYGFPIGGVAAFDWEEGVVSPGGVGYDINCGVRLATTALSAEDLQPRVRELVEALFRNIPSGVGSTGAITLSRKEERRVMREGSRWALTNGYAEDRDLEHTEEEGCLETADPEAVSERALERGRRQLGTLGAGNHFVEVGVVERIFDVDTAAAFGLFEGQATVMIHSGSRGFGYQICDDFLAEMAGSPYARDIRLPDRQLACAPLDSELGRRYLGAMACAANYAWANRQVMLHRIRETFQMVLGMGPRALSMNLLYDVCHNIAKEEAHEVDGVTRRLCVHRKGATRSFAPGHDAVCAAHRRTGQAVIIPGDMGTASYVLAGTRKAMTETFGSTCHGAGRLLSRKQAVRRSRGRSIQRELEDRGIQVRWSGRSTLAEEMPDAYKDVDAVVAVVAGAGISKKVARLRPVAVIKG
jgi:tRNA-splicing ligase RtcB